MKKWFRSFGLPALLVILLCTPVFGAKIVPRIVRVGYFDYEGFLELSGDEYTGYGYDYLEEISTYLGWDYEYVYGSWEQCLERLKTGEIDLLCTAQYSKERAEIYDYAKYASGVEYATLLVAGDNQTVYYNDFTSFNGLRVGFMKGSYQNSLFEEYAHENGFHYEPVYYDTAKALQAALDAGEIDAMLTGSLQKIMGEKAVAKFAPEPFYFITTKGNRVLMEELNSALEAIQTADADFNSKLYAAYYGEASASQLAFTREEAAYIRAHPVLRVAYDGAWSPISYQNDETNDFDGVCAGLMDLLSQRSGITFTFIRAPKEADAVRLLESGEVDILCGVDNRYTPKTQQDKIQLTKSLFGVPVAISKPSYLPFEKIRWIAIPENCQSIQRYTKIAYPGAQVKIYPDTEACMLAVKRGEVDAVIENIYILDQYAKDKQFSELEPVLSSQVTLPLCLGMRQEEDLALRTLLNKLITQLDSQKVNEILIRKTTEGPHLHLGGWLRRYLAPIIVSIVLVILLFVIYSSYRTRRYAFRDPLTGYGNMTKFLLATKKLEKEKGYRGHAIISIDIDKFKFINNVCGFQTGNRVLKEICDRISVEVERGELFCREANDHYFLLLRVDSIERLNDRLSRLVKQISSVPSIISENFAYTVSCGVYLFQKGDRDIHQAIGWANLAREQAKNISQDSVVIYDDSMRRETQREQGITNRMKAALQNGEFTVYYQPKVRLSDERIIGAEALTRWLTVEGPAFYPDEFIPVFERNGFISQLDPFVFEEVCRQLRHWTDMGIDICPISVNLSRVHLSRPDFYLKYLEIMHRYRIDPGLVELEITEGTIFENKTQVASLISSLQKEHIRISIDDFGSGYSSLNLMKDLPFDFLKLDKEFFNVSADSKRGQEIIRSVIEMARRLHMTVVAEGVETQEQVEFLKKNHCDMVQGFYYSKPLPADDFERMLQVSRGGE